MCGIAGIVGSRLPAGEIEAALERMAEAMRHRGPDQSAVLLVPELDGGLAVRRLALVDVEGGDQPIANESGDVLALLNGEIYNHERLRHELEAQGHVFRTRCDTEVLAHLYEEARGRDGERFLERLEGMFGLAIFDRARRRLLIARDGPGIKPLYYARTARVRLRLRGEGPVRVGAGGTRARAARARRPSGDRLRSRADDGVRRRREARRRRLRGGRRCRGEDSTSSGGSPTPSTLPRSRTTSMSTSWSAGCRRRSTRTPEPTCRSARC